MNHELLQKLKQQFDEFSKLTQIAVYALAAGMLFLAWDMTLGQWTSKMRADADRIVEQVKIINSGEKTSGAIQRTIALLGESELPTSKPITSDRLVELLNDLTEKYDLEDAELTRNKSSKIASKNVPGVANSGETLEVIKADWRFRSSPETVISVVRELEASPAIESITELRLSDPSTTRNRNSVAIRCSLSAWASTSKRGAR